MDLTVLLFLASGLFLGWTLGANDAANVFGTAVGTRMVRFYTAAIVCSIFVILGAVVSGGGAAHTLGKLGSVNALPGAFMAALAAGITVYGMTRSGLPVSTTQAIVGAIIGWNLYTDSVTDATALVKIVSTWIVCPVLAGVVAVPLYKLVDRFVTFSKIHLLRLDAYTRIALIAAGAFGAYSLGANNIANVMGVFVPVSPFTDFSVAGIFTLTSIQQLFLLGAIAIAVGVFTYSKKVMLTVGQDLAPMSPPIAWVVVVAHSVVLFLFASEGLENLLAQAGLPTIPLVPVSSSQAVVGAVIGLGLMKGSQGIRWRVLGAISAGWVTTPIISAFVCFVALFFLENVFNQQVARVVRYDLSPQVIERLAAEGFPVESLADLNGRRYLSAKKYLDVIDDQLPLDSDQQRLLLYYGALGSYHITTDAIHKERPTLSRSQLDAVIALDGQTYQYKWQLAEALAEQSVEWRLKPTDVLNKHYNQRINQRLDALYRLFDRY